MHTPILKYQKPPRLRELFRKVRAIFPASLRHESETQQKLFKQTCSNELCLYYVDFLGGGFASSDQFKAEEVNILSCPMFSTPLTCRFLMRPLGESPLSSALALELAPAAHASEACWGSMTWCAQLASPDPELARFGELAVWISGRAKSPKTPK